MLTWVLYNTRLISQLSTGLHLSTSTIHLDLLVRTLLSRTASTDSQPFTLPKLNPARKLGLSTGSKFYKRLPNFKSSFQTSTVHMKLPARVMKIFQATFIFTNSLNLRDFNPHPAFRLLFMKDARGGPKIISFDFYFKRWKQTYLLLFNLFYAHNALPTFGSRVFKTEILALNWSFNLFTYRLFKYSAPFYIFEDESYGFSPLLVLKRWRRQTINYLFLLELKIFKKFQHFFKTLSFIIIGLVPMNLNPWLVSYPIPAFSDSRFIQYYFIKLISFIRQNASTLRFRQRHHLWLKTLKV